MKANSQNNLNRNNDTNIISRLFDLVIDNGSYKLVALFISLILWLTILGRRDFIYSKNIDIEFQTSQNLSILEQSHNSVRVRVTGPRASLKKFMESNSNNAILLDISNAGEGKIEVPVSEKRLDLPLGVKVVSIKPAIVEATVITKKTFNDENIKMNEYKTKSKDDDTEIKKENNQ